MDAMTLEVWPGEFQLPSFDTTCLQYIACAKFANVPVNIRHGRSPWSTPEGGYPVFQGTACNRFADFAKSMKALSPNEHFDVASEDEFAKMEALKSLTIVHIRPIYLYALWLHDHNFAAITQPWIIEMLGVVYSIYYSRKMRRHAHASLKQHFGHVNDVATIEDDILAHAERGFKILSDHLGNKKYFFGDRPTSSDAFIFGYLAVLVYTPFPDYRIQQCIQFKFANLYQFVRNVMDVYLPLPEETLKIHFDRLVMWEKRRSDYQKRWSTNSVDKKRTHYPLWEKLLFGFVSIGVSVAFAAASGIIKIPIERGEKDVPNLTTENSDAPATKIEKG